MRRKTPGKPRPARRRSLIWRLIRWPLRAMVSLALIAALWVGVYRVINPPGGVYMAAEAFRLGGASYDWRDMDRISPNLARAVIAAEDARFCDHNGFDFDAIRAALKANEQGRRVRGGSTITQQVAKNVFLWHQRSWLRKGLEAGFTVLIELMWPKRRILEIYLNTAEFDAGIFGAEAASRHHFGVSSERLSMRHSARLAAILPNPKGRDPNRLSADLRRRVGRIVSGAQTIARARRDRCLGL